MNLDNQPSTVIAHVVISGRVIMVGFRAACQIKANELNLTGWVRNLEESWPIVGTGKVEAVFEGSRSGIEKMIAWCKQGPTLASIDKVEVEWQKATGEFKQFEVRY